MRSEPYYNIRHSIPGRLRVGFPSLMSQKDRIARVKKDLSEIPSIKKVSANPSCGSVTIYYDSDATRMEAIVKIIEKLHFHNRPSLNRTVERPKRKDDIRHELDQEGNKKSGTRRVWKLAGSLSLGVGLVGVFVPLLPTIPLFVLAAFCYFRASSGLYDLLINSGRVGRLIDNIHKGRGLSARTKLRAIFFMWISLIISILFLVSGLTLRIILLFVGLLATHSILRIKTYVPKTESKRMLTAPEKDTF